jgi:hypothetical protein
MIECKKMNEWRKNIQVLVSSRDANPVSVLIVRAGNVADPELFHRASRRALEQFSKCGYTVYALDVDIKRDYLEFQNGSLPERKLGDSFREALRELPGLGWIQIYSHARYDVNLTDPGAELSAVPIEKRDPEPYNQHRVYIGDLHVGHPGLPVDWIDLFTCMTRPFVQWPQLMADSLGWVVRSVAPGYSIYFPRHRYPRAQFPSARLISTRKYDPEGWVMWLPGWSRPLPARSPSDSDFCTVEESVRNHAFWHQLAARLEPVREWRKARQRKQVLSRMS